MVLVFYTSTGHSQFDLIFVSYNQNYIKSCFYSVLIKLPQGHNSHVYELPPGQLGKD